MPPRSGSAEQLPQPVLILLAPVSAAVLVATVTLVVGGSGGYWSRVGAAGGTAEREASASARSRILSSSPRSSHTQRHSGSSRFHTGALAHNQGR